MMLLPWLYARCHIRFALLVFRHITLRDMFIFAMLLCYYNVSDICGIDASARWPRWQRCVRKCASAYMYDVCVMRRCWLLLGWRTMCYSASAERRSRVRRVYEVHIFVAGKCVSHLHETAYAICIYLLFKEAIFANIHLRYCMAPAYILQFRNAFWAAYTWRGMYCAYPGSYVYPRFLVSSCRGARGSSGIIYIYTKLIHNLQCSMRTHHIASAFREALRAVFSWAIVVQLTNGGKFIPQATRTF